MRFSPVLLLATLVAGSVRQKGNRCELYPESLDHGGKPVDDVPSIHDAFKRCGKDGTVVFTKNTFNIGSVMNTTNLVNCDVELHGTLKYSTDIAYWRLKSYPVIYQNHTTAWLFGGTNVTFKGVDGGHIDGSGQAWYTFNRGKGNMPGRPIQITVFNSTNVWMDHLRIVQPIFWASFVWQSKNVSIVNYYSNATSTDGNSTTNTDGFDSWNSENLLIHNATVHTDDDCIAVKGNTTNMLIKNVTCINGAGTTIGSIGQYPDMPDYVSNIVFDNITCISTSGCAYIKTWQGDYLNKTTNGDGGGGGGGRVKNVTFQNYRFKNVALPIQISQCIYAGEGGHGCNTSKLAIEDVRWVNYTGTSRYNIGASIYCSALHPCPGIKFENVNITGINATLGLPYWDTKIQYEVFQCANILGQKCSGIGCNRVAPEFFSQTVRKNIQ